MGVTLHHNLLNLIFLNVLVNLVRFSGLQSRQFVEAVCASRHVVALKRDTELLSDSWVFNFLDTEGFLFLKLLLSCLNLTSKNHQASKKNRYRLDL